MRKLSLSLAALALVALFGFAASKPAHAFQLNGCTTVYIEGYQFTAKVVDPGTLQNTTVFTEGCQIGVALTHGGQTIKNVSVIGSGFGNMNSSNYTLADITVTGSSSNSITNVNLTGAFVGVFVYYSTATITNATITGTVAGIFTDAGYQGTVTLKNSNLFDNLIGVDAYRSHISTSYNNIHENFFGGLFAYGSYGGSSHDTFYGNQGVGVSADDSAGGLSLRYDNIDNNGYGAPCSYGILEVSCTNTGVSVNILGKTQSFNGFYAGVEAYDSKLDLNHTLVRYNAVGIAAFNFSYVTLSNYSVVCNNHNSSMGNANVITDGYATVTANNTSHICF